MFLRRLKNSFIVKIISYFILNFIFGVLSIFFLIYEHYYFFMASFLVYLFIILFIYIELKRFKNFLEWIIGFNYEKPLPENVMKKNDDIKEFLISFRDKLIEERRIIKEKTALEEYRLSFLSRISHELLSPISIMKGYITLLSKKEKDVKKLDYIEKIMRSVSRLESMINNFIVSAREGFYPRAYDFKVFDFTELIFDIYEEYLPIAQERNINYIMRLPPFPNTVIGDPEALKSAISNLVNNALKYTPQGGEVVMEAVKENGKIKFMVKDTGPGIKKEELNLIFRPYFQGKSSRTKKGGMGLGLTIAKEIIEAHGSQLYVNSETGKGTCFYFYLPLRI